MLFLIINSSKSQNNENILDFDEKLLTVNVNNPQIKKDIEYNLKKYTKFINQNVNEIHIDINMNKNSKEISESNGDPYYCKASLSYKNNNKPVILNDFNQDVIFTILHEISHCILNKEVLYKNIYWNTTIPISDQKKLQAYIDEEEKNYLKQQYIKKIPPLLVYHEIFADTLTILMMQYYKEENIKNITKELITYREKKFKNHKLLEKHVSNNALEHIKNIDINRLKEEDLINMALNISQNSFIEYLIWRSKQE